MHMHIWSEKHLKNKDATTRTTTEPRTALYGNIKIFIKRSNEMTLRKKSCQHTLIYIHGIKYIIENGDYNSDLQ